MSNKAVNEFEAFYLAELNPVKDSLLSAQVQLVSLHETWIIKASWQLIQFRTCRKEKERSKAMGCPQLTGQTEGPLDLERPCALMCGMQVLGHCGSPYLTVFQNLLSFAIHKRLPATAVTQPAFPFTLEVRALMENNEKKNLYKVTQ